MTLDASWQARRGLVLLNRFRLDHFLGHGGMGEVWRAHDRQLNLDMALKLLHPELAAAPAQVEFLKNECRLARSLNHPHIVQVYDFHQEGQTVFISMAWVEGTGFDDWIMQKERPWRARLRPLLAIARALDYVHGKGLVHRDVKAGNILLDREAKPYLTDFGIAGVHRFASDPELRFAGGSPYCMSPQQRRGHPPHPSDDIYSFGIMLLEALAPSALRSSAKGAAPARFTRQSLAAMADRPSPLVDLVAGMLAAERDDRPSDMAVVASILDRVLAPRGPRTIPPESGAGGRDDACTPSSATVVTPQPFGGPEIPATRSETHFGWRLPVFIGALALLLLAGGGGLIHYLTRHPWVREPISITAPRKTATAPTPPAASPSATPEAEQEDGAQQALADWQKALADLEAIGGPQWGAEPFAAVAAEARAGDEAFLAGDFAAAARHYLAAEQQARRMEAQAPDALAALLAKGQAALEEGDGARSGEHFDLALKIDPQNPTARLGLARAATIAEVVALMQTAREHEAVGSPALALTDYEAALALDPDWGPAREAVAQLRRQIARDQFQHHMSAGLNALQRKAYGDARREINQALTFQPDAPEAVDALTQIDISARDDRLTRLRAAASRAEADEAWDQALAYYRQVLEIDPVIRFAVLGAERAAERLRLAKRVAYYVAHPEDLGREAYLEKAQELLDTLRSLAPQGPRLQSQIASLGQMVQNARQPVMVTLKSDDQTEVTVHRIGRLGQFATRRLELRPGTYTIAGARDGYKDVRHTLRIRPGQGPTQVVVQCTEKI